MGYDRSGAVGRRVYHRSRIGYDRIRYLWVPSICLLEVPLAGGGRGRVTRGLAPCCAAFRCVFSPRAVWAQATVLLPA